MKDFIYLTIITTESFSGQTSGYVKHSDIRTIFPSYTSPESTRITFIEDKYPPILVKNTVENIAFQIEQRNLT